jgi:hypothetical protein
MDLSPVLRPLVRSVPVGLGKRNRNRPRKRPGARADGRGGSPRRKPRPKAALRRSGTIEPGRDLHIASHTSCHAVVAMACDDEVIPLQERIESVKRRLRFGRSLQYSGICVTSHAHADATRELHGQCHRFGRRYSGDRCARVQHRRQFGGCSDRLSSNAVD